MESTIISNQENTSLMPTTTQAGCSQQSPSVEEEYSPPDRGTVSSIDLVTADRDALSLGMLGDPIPLSRGIQVL